MTFDSRKCFSCKLLPSFSSLTTHQDKIKVNVSTKRKEDAKKKINCGLEILIRILLLMI